MIVRVTKKESRNSQGLTSCSLKHRVSFSYGYELPFGSGKRFASNMSRLVQHVFGG